MTAPLNIRDNTVAGYIDLTILEDALLGMPEALYVHANSASTKHGPQMPGQGSTFQLNRLLPLESPDPDNLDAYLAGADLTDNSITDASLQQATDFSKVTITVRRRRMPKPVSEKYETLQLSQVDLERAQKINLRRNYMEFIDDYVREEKRRRACTKIWGNLRASAAAMSGDRRVDGFTVGMIKEFKRRADLLHIRGFGSEPGGDLQALAGSFRCTTDQVGINEITEDPLWRDYVIRDPQGEKGRIVKGYVGEIEQVIIVKSERMRRPSVGISGSPFEGHEAIFEATDPVVIEPAGPNDVQGFQGDNPVVLALMGTPEVKRAAEDKFAENLIHTWFQTMGCDATEKMTQAVASALQVILGGASDFSKGVPLVNTSRFIHIGLFV